ncbi:helix-turn-helix domain-containing protein [Pseudonocardia spinosispora]|uniref:helix-turn-helix domain-containing protein n=1 Tax=Pseudonocardia spinosispora TaxID=103441 RepID=UPI00146FBCDC|nr:Scr1 family TA system antitoxin-like transcriptional regulator [Pseudonocardia spinosispora]
MARRLKALREQNMMSLDEVSKRMYFSDSKLSRIENCENRITHHELKSLLDIYGVTADRWPEYFAMLEASVVGGWWRAYGLPEKGYLPLEADASLVRCYSLAIVPGLLQTHEYARAGFQRSIRQLSPEQVKRDVRIRMIRQKRLTSATDPLRLVSIVDEVALHRPAGNSEIMVAQLEHLIEKAVLGNVTLQVLPTSLGSHPGQNGSFSVLSFDDAGEPDVAYVEHPLGSMHTEREAIVTKARTRFDHLQSLALPPEESAALIRRIAERY